MEQQNVVAALALTLMAGLSTGVGSAIAFFAKKGSGRFLAVSLGFSAGVMIYVSMVEIFASAQETLSRVYGAKAGSMYAVFAFFVGMALIGAIDRLIPDESNPHEAKPVDAESGASPSRDRLMRSGLLTALAIGVHNFPEGLAAFVSALQAPEVAIPIVAAIAIHNIPEGVAVSVPVYYATGSKKKAFVWSFVSGLSEPVGAAIGYLILMPFLTEAAFGLIYAGVAGIMVFISLDELLPSAREYGEHHLSMYGLAAGMAVMAVSLWLFI